MSTLWTPSGEHPVDPKAPGGAQDVPRGAAAERAGAGRDEPDPADYADPDDPAEAAEIEELRRQLAETPADIVVANHCYGLFELAAVYLSQRPPLLPQAQLAIDALGALIEGLAGRLGETEPQLREALAQIRLGFVQVEAATRAAEESPAQHSNGVSGTGG
jgi:hypothetical protein